MALDPWTMGALASLDAYPPQVQPPVPPASDRNVWGDQLTEADQAQLAREAAAARVRRPEDPIWRMGGLAEQAPQVMQQDLLQAAMGELPKLPPGYAYNDQNIPYEVATGKELPITPRPAAVPFTRNPVTGGIEGAIPAAADVLGNMIGGPGGRLAAKAPVASIATGAARAARLASPEEIARAAAATREGITYPQLRDLYQQLGLTGQEPLDIAKRSLAAGFSAKDIKAATELKLADREVLADLTKKQLATYREGGGLPEGVTLPSQEAAQAGLEAFRPIKKEVTKAEQAFDAATAAGRPMGSLFDVSPQTLMRTPDVPQFPLPRAPPKLTERLESVNRGGVARLERAAAAAPPENWGWYNLMQQRDFLHQLHGPEKGEQVFQSWLDSLAGTSMLNPIDNNLRSSTWYLQRILAGEPLPQVLQLKDPSGRTVSTLVGGPEAGYGAKSQIQHADRVREYLSKDYDPVLNPKPISYRMNLGGNWDPRTVDTHDIRNMIGMPAAKQLFGENSTLLPGEYSYFEDVGARAARRAGTQQAPQQAATWVGGGEYTGLKSYPAPLLEALNRRAAVTGMVRGISPEEAMIQAFSKGGKPLLSQVPIGTMGELARQD